MAVIPGSREVSNLIRPQSVTGLIDGAWVQGSGHTKEIRNPADGTIVSTVKYFTDEQVDAAVAAAREAQHEWSRVPITERARMIRAGLDMIVEHGEEISRWVCMEMGKTIRQAREEVVSDITVPVSRQIVEDALRFGGKVVSTGRPDYYPTRRVLILNQPIGVTGFISPWNFPVEMLLNCVASLMMGNTCVWKPSEWVPYAPQLATEVFIRGAGLPDGALNLVYGGPETGERLVAHRDVGLIAFIGSTAVGEAITRAAGIKRLLLELGGNGPVIVMADADLNRAVESVFNDCFYQAGQVCTAGERILVHEAVHDEFAARLATKAAAIKMGDPLDEATEMGPLSDQRIADKVTRHVADAVSKGAILLSGGRSSGLFYDATVLTGVTPDMDIAREETFGPVAPIIKVRDADEALALANASDYGLSMAVFTNDLATAFKFAEGLEAGQVNVNSGTNDWELNGPFGGWKRSGIGREIGGDESLRMFTNLKTVGLDLPS